MAEERSLVLHSHRRSTAVMKIGDLVRIKKKGSKLGLFVVRSIHDDGLWVKVYSLSSGDNHNLRIGTLEVINESR